MVTQNQRRVVVTGMGAICPIGLNVDDVWAAAAAGVSGIGPITRFDPAAFETTFAGEVRGFDPNVVVGRKEARRMDRFMQFAVGSALQAMEEARIDQRIPPERIGTLIGTAMGGIETFEQGAEVLLREGPRRLGPFFVPMMLPNMASGVTAIATGAKGPNFAPTSACASAAHAIGEAAQMIQRDDVDVMFAGGAEAPVTRLGVAGFNAMGALSRRNDAPERASRPFDGERDGFVLAEGGAVLVLEEREHALRRGAVPIAELSGYGSTDDANHMVQPGPGGEGAARAIRRALDVAGLQSADIDYINAHGTSTQLNEKLETQALKTAFGEHAYRLAISSTKSMTGHLLGAAGSLEAVIAIKALTNQCVPPTINYEFVDPECDLDYVSNVARPLPLSHVLSNSMGFGGHNVALIFSRPS
ncbi:MAG: beta-ketoacyl-ACP synthase II [Thermomicrobiales bacterium]